MIKVTTSEKMKTTILANKTLFSDRKPMAKTGQTVLLRTPRETESEQDKRRTFQMQ